MSNGEERILEQPMPVKSGLPSAEEVRRAAILVVVREILRTRSMLLPIGSVALTMIVLFDPTRFKLLVLGAFILAMSVLTSWDRLRLKSGSERDLTFAFVDVAIMILLQTSVIWLTGAVESPLLLAYVVAGFASGIALGDTRAMIPALLLITVCLWSMTLAGIFQLIPRSLPSFFDLEPGFAGNAAYAATKATVLNIVVIIAALIGRRVKQTLARVVEATIDAREQALQSLRDRNRELVHLSSTVAHELKNPLASIQGLVQLLERGGANSEKRFEVLQGEIARMRTTLDAFLNLSRPIGDLSIETVEVSSIISELVTLHEGLARGKNITVTADHKNVARVACDPRKMKQALTNLLQNAIEATPQGGQIWLRVSADQSGAVSFAVEDSGTGIAPDLLPRVMEVGMTTKPGGSGIGLAVARSIAEQHGGRLTLENREGNGLRALLLLENASRAKEIAT